MHKNNTTQTLLIILLTAAPILSMQAAAKPSISPMSRKCPTTAKACCCLTACCCLVTSYYCLALQSQMPASEHSPCSIPYPVKPTTSSIQTRIIASAALIKPTKHSMDRKKVAALRKESSLMNRNRYYGYNELQNRNININEDPMLLKFYNKGVEDGFNGNEYYSGPLLDDEYIYRFGLWDAYHIGRVQGIEERFNHQKYDL